jgi:hypothetical protein
VNRSATESEIASAGTESTTMLALLLATASEIASAGRSATESESMSE